VPLSEEKDVGSNIKRLARSHPEFPPKRRVAVAMSESRRAGGNAPPKGVIQGALARLRARVAGGKS